VGHYNGILFNWSSSLGAWALGGPLWAIITFLGVALVRVSLDAQALRLDNLELRRRLFAKNIGEPFAPENQEAEEAPPHSEVRVSRSAIDRKRLANHG
jgi:hypothetical protein